MKSLTLTRLKEGQILKYIDPKKMAAMYNEKGLGGVAH